MRWRYVCWPTTTRRTRPVTPRPNWWVRSSIDPVASQNRLVGQRLHHYLLTEKLGEGEDGVSCIWPMTYATGPPGGHQGSLPSVHPEHRASMVSACGGQAQAAAAQLAPRNQRRCMHSRSSTTISTSCPNTYPARPCATKWPPAQCHGRLLLDTGIDIAAALADGRHQGIGAGTSRPVSQSNVIRTADGRIKILDFGLARSCRAPRAAGKPRGLRPNRAWGPPGNPGVICRQSSFGEPRFSGRHLFVRGAAL